MATTIKLKNSVTTTNAPSSLVQGEVAINITDKKVWVGNAATTPIQLLGAGASGTFGALTCTSLTNSGLTSGRVTYASTGGLLADSANFTFNGTTVTMANDASISGLTVGKGGGAVASNTVVGYQALNGNSTGARTTAIGYQAGLTNTANDCLFVGHSAGSSATSGTNNTYIGRAAGPVINVSTGNDNTATGYQSLFYLSSGAYNSAFGSFSLNSNTTGSYNTAIGNQALIANTTASNNTAVGYQASYNNTTGQITSLGYQAGFSNTTGIQSTFIGYQAGYNTTGSANTFVGGGTAAAAGYFVTTGTKNTILGGYHGNQDSYDMRTLSNRVVISDGDGNRQLTMYEGGTVALDSAVPAAGTGITFPATQSASSNANTLDDYEEGTWTPTAIGETTAGTTTYDAQYGYYTKIGRQVNITCIVAWSALTGTGNLLIQGLPFSIANLTQNFPVGAVLTDVLNWSGGTYLVAEGQPNTSQLKLLCLGDDAGVTVQQCVNEIAAARITLTYFTAT